MAKYQRLTREQQRQIKPDLKWHESIQPSRGTWDYWPLFLTAVINLIIAGVLAFLR